MWEILLDVQKGRITKPFDVQSLPQLPGFDKVPIRNEMGDVIGILGSYEDVTERAIAEASLQSFSEGLHEMAQSTADKSGQQLFESCVEPDPR